MSVRLCLKVVKHKVIEAMELTQLDIERLYYIDTFPQPSSATFSFRGSCGVLSVEQ